MKNRVILDMRPEVWRGVPMATVLYARSDGTYSYRFYYGERHYARAKLVQKSVKWILREIPWWEKLLSQRLPK